MIEIPLASVPNQTFSIVLDERLYEIALYAIDTGNIVLDGATVPNTVMAVDITRDGVVIMTGMRVMPDYPMIPYRYLEAGNFVFITSEGDYPDYLQFGITQTMIYLSEAELAELRAGV